MIYFCLLPPLPPPPREAMRTDALVPDLQKNEPGYLAPSWASTRAPGALGDAHPSSPVLLGEKISELGSNLLLILPRWLISGHMERHLDVSNLRPEDMFPGLLIHSLMSLH